MDKKEFFNSRSGTVKILRSNKYPFLVGKQGVVSPVSRWYVIVKIPSHINYNSRYGGYAFRYEDLELLPLTINQMELFKTFQHLEEKYGVGKIFIKYSKVRKGYYFAYFYEEDGSVEFFDDWKMRSRTVQSLDEKGFLEKVYSSINNAFLGFRFKAETGDLV